jgi:hypothetical protein
MGEDHDLTVRAAAEPADHVRQLFLLAVDVGEEPLRRHLHPQCAESPLDQTAQRGVVGAARPPVRVAGDEPPGLQEDLAAADRLGREI